MQHLLCKACSANKTAGITTTPAVLTGRFAGPGEVIRVIFGIAKQPQVKQRTVYINGVPQTPMALTHYNCDRCNAEIRPGERCGAMTIWREGGTPIANWEAEYMEEA